MRENVPVMTALTTETVCLYLYPQLTAGLSILAGFAEGLVSSVPAECHLLQEKNKDKLKVFTLQHKMFTFGFAEAWQNKIISSSSKV